MVATHIKKIKHNMLSVTDVYLRDITNNFCNFALERESPNNLLFLIFANVRKIMHLVLFFVFENFLLVDILVEVTGANDNSMNS